MSVGVPLSPGVTPLPAVAALVGRQLAVAIGANQPQIVAPIIRRIAIDVVHDERQGRTKPHVGSCADRAATGLSAGQVLPNVVIAATVDPRFAGFQPALCARSASRRCLACVAAEHLLTTLQKWRTATAALSHVDTLWGATDNRLEPIRGASYRD